MAKTKNTTDCLIAGTGVMPQRVIREGDKAQEVLNLIEDDEDIAALVLAAATSKEGPGPLVFPPPK